jgi:pimeloyl-ACP methyl ester carboxylesterase
MEKVYSVKGGDGLKLHVREWGNADGGPILLIHGWSQNHLCWKKQYESSLAEEFRLVALDLRGHGMSEAPLESENYTRAELWADDIAAVLEQLGLNRPVLVGWSYGGFIISDYVRAHGQYGQSPIAGVNYVGAAVTLNEGAFGTLIGPGFLNHAEGAMAPDLPTNIEAMRNFLRDCITKPISQDDFETALAWNIVVPAQVRAGLASREINSDDVLKNMTVPVLVTHGKEDIVILPSMGEHILNICPTAKASWYEGVGHATFIEDPERFNQELAAFTRQAQ